MMADALRQTEGMAGLGNQLGQGMLTSRLVPAVAFLALALVVLALVGRVREESITGAAQAIDGDSLIVNGREMRLKGLDAPESRQTCRVAGRDVNCGREAAFALRRWLARGPVTCIGHETDRYNRLLVACRVAGQDIGADLVRNGHAVDLGGYPREQAFARGDGRGIWAGDFEMPAEWRRRHRADMPMRP